MHSLRNILFATATAALLAVITSCQESLEDRCAREAKEYTEKKCPARISDNTVIDSLTFDRATHTMHYYYTISGPGDNQQVIDRLNPRKLLVKEVKNSTTTKSFKDAGYNFAYTYHSGSRKGVELFTVVITEKDYK